MLLGEPLHLFTHDEVISTDSTRRFSGLGMPQKARARRPHRRLPDRVSENDVRVGQILALVNLALLPIRLQAYGVQGKRN